MKNIAEKTCSVGIILIVGLLLALILVQAYQKEPLNYLREVRENGIENDLLESKKGDLLEDNTGYLYHVISHSSPKSQIICEAGQRGRIAFIPGEARRYITRVYARDYEHGIDKDSKYTEKAVQYLGQ